METERESMDTVAVLFWAAAVPWSIILFIFWLVLRIGKTKPHILTHRATSTESNRELEQDSFEDSQGDGLMSEGDLLFPEEPEPEDDS